MLRFIQMLVLYMALMPIDYKRHIIYKYIWLESLNVK